MVLTYLEPHQHKEKSLLECSCLRINPSGEHRVPDPWDRASGYGRGGGEVTAIEKIERRLTGHLNFRTQNT